MAVFRSSTVEDARRLIPKPHHFFMLQGEFFHQLLELSIFLLESCLPLALLVNLKGLSGMSQKLVNP